MSKNLSDYIQLPSPDDSIQYFEYIKNVSEEYWQSTVLNKNIYGFQIQPASKWQPGLTDKQIENLEKKLGFEFPFPLRNFYKTMNGLSKPCINIYGNNGTKTVFAPMFFSYPNDLDLIKNKINWIYEANSVSEIQLQESGISRIFPVFAHRCMLIDVKGGPILSMHGDDIIYWADNLSKLLAIEIFTNIYNIYSFESNQNARTTIKFWLDN